MGCKTRSIAIHSLFQAFRSKSASEIDVGRRREGGGNEGRQESERGGGGGGSLAIVPVSPCFCPIFHAYDLSRSPPSECRLYVLKVWNRLCYSSQVVCFCCPFYRVFITLDIILLRMSSFSALLPLLYCMFFQQNKTIDHFTVILAFE